MMKPNKDIELLKNFLISKTDVGRNISKEIAIQNIMNIKKSIGKDNCKPTEEEIEQYMMNNHQLMINLTDEAITNLCRSILPKKSFFSSIPSFTITSFFIAVPMGYLIKDFITHWRINTEADNATQIVSILFLLAFLIASVFSKKK